MIDPAPQDPPVTESDLEDQAAEAAIEQHLDMLNDPYYSKEA